MALTEFQRGVCRLLAENRIRGGDSYVAGGAALNELLRAPRHSRDLNLFHDTEQALATSWKADRETLEASGYRLAVVRERPTFVEAEVRKGHDGVIVQWAHDSAYRFFPLVKHDELGLVLHPFDLATSKVLALVGRVEPRDFVDTLTCDREVQPLGLLAWAACGKDPGFSPAAILEQSARSVRYSQAELDGLDFRRRGAACERALPALARHPGRGAPDRVAAARARGRPGGDGPQRRPVPRRARGITRSRPATGAHLP
jgi:hypothetical protein